MEPMERFMQYVHKETSPGCWQWTGPQNLAGYGSFGVGRASKRNAHRWLWEQINGTASPKLHVDHLCRNRLCVNPDHLELVTHEENLRRGKQPDRWSKVPNCPQGHAYSEANTGYTGNARYCRECKRIRNRAARQKRASARQTL